MATQQRERKFNMLFRSKEEKLAAVDFAKNVRDFDSLNAYLLHLFRQDRRAHEQSEKKVEEPQMEAGQRR